MPDVRLLPVWVEGPLGFGLMLSCIIVQAFQLYNIFVKLRPSSRSEAGPREEIGYYAKIVILIDSVSCNPLPTAKLVAVSNVIAFANPNAPLYPRLAKGTEWNEDKRMGRVRIRFYLIMIM